jgi:hypothetical protein
MAKNTEEYQLEEGGEYTEDEGFESPQARAQRAAPVAGAPASRTANSGPSGLPFNLPVKNKKMAIIIGVFVILFFIMQIIKLFSPGAKEKIQEQPVISVETNKKVSPVSADSSMLNERYLANDTKIQQLQKEMEDTKASIDSMNKTVYDLNTMIQQLTTEVQTLVAEKAMAQKTMKEKQTPYHIRAIVNGRAWLEANNGATTITVRPGSSLGKYGKVSEIDDKNGLVNTDKGAVIRYGKNDM